jgi:hypothetical protein
VSNAQRGQITLVAMGFLPIGSVVGGELLEPGEPLPHLGKVADLVAQSEMGRFGQNEVAGSSAGKWFFYVPHGWQARETPRRCAPAASPTGKQLRHAGSDRLPSVRVQVGGRIVAARAPCSSSGNRGSTPRSYPRNSARLEYVSSANNLRRSGVRATAEHPLHSLDGARGRAHLQPEKFLTSSHAHERCRLSVSLSQGARIRRTGDLRRSGSIHSLAIPRRASRSRCAAVGREMSASATH